MGSSESDSKMGVPEAVLQKVGSLPDIASMSKDDLATLCKQLYERSCNVFGEKFDVEYQVKKRDMEIHNLEMETSESHGTFKIPKLKKVNKFNDGRRGREVNSSVHLFCPTMAQLVSPILTSSSSSSHPLEHLFFNILSN